MSGAPTALSDSRDYCVGGRECGMLRVSWLGGLGIKINCVIVHACVQASVCVLGWERQNVQNCLTMCDQNYIGVW